MGDLPKWKTWKCFQYWSFLWTTRLWNTWKWFQPRSCEILESDFNIDLVKYMKVISAMVLWTDPSMKYMKVISTLVSVKYMKVISDICCEIHESDFNNDFVKYMKVISAMVLWNTWKWFQYWSYFPGEQPICEIHENDFKIGFVKYMELMSTSVLWNTWKWFQYWCCEIHESDFSNGFVNWPVC